MYKYFLNISGNEKQVTREEFIEMERSCEFYSKISGEIATGGFSFSKGSLEIKGIVAFDYNQDGREV